MRLAVFSESPADEAALRVLVTPLIGNTASEDTELRIRSRGWPSVRELLPSIIKQLHYRTTVDALLVVVDSDDSTPHSSHGSSGPGDCRLCALRQVVDVEIGKLRDVPGRSKLKTAIGLCVPAIEAWYLCGVEPSVTEAEWRIGRDSGHPPYSRLDLKRRAYGTPIPTLADQTAKAVQHAERLAADLNGLRTGSRKAVGRCWIR